MGIELISAVQCQMSHSQYLVVETDDYAKLYELFMPFQGISTADFTPVRGPDGPISGPVLVGMRLPPAGMFVETITASGPDPA